MDFFNVIIFKKSFRKCCSTQIIQKKKKREKGKEHKKEEKKEEKDIIFVESWEEVVFLLGPGGEKYGSCDGFGTTDEIFNPDFDSGFLYLL